MRASLKGILILVGTCAVLVNCSRKKNTFVSRNYHALTAKDNAMYNGYLALDEGKNGLIETYADNYWEILPVERMEVFEQVTLPGQTKNPNFERAEEKAVKAIQKHSMNIKGREYNPQMDEAYLLLGKARYFDQRFIPALEAFNYILYKYPTSDKINQAKIWREKTNLRLDNVQLAVDNLNDLMEQQELEGQDLADATSTLAQAYIYLEEFNQAIEQLKIASVVTKDKEEEGRYLFIEGQLYNELGQKDSANLAFDRIIELKRKTPRVYWVNAQIEKAKNFEYETGDKTLFLEHLNKMAENRENRPYLDKIFHQIGEYYRLNDSSVQAFTYYNKSLRTNSEDKVLKARNYRTMGDMSFDDAQYKLAGAYYDSTLTQLEARSKPYRTIKRKRDNLDDVIRYEDIAQRNDSILGLVNSTEAERVAYFTKYAENLKTADEAAKKAAEDAALAKAYGNQAELGGNVAPDLTNSGGPNNVSTFYFYNANTVAYGKNEFRKLWGDRKLEDNWRWSEKQASAIKQDEVVNEEQDVVTDVEQKYDPQFYIAQLPTEQEEIDSITTERNFAYYRLGLIYKEKFSEYGLAEDKFTQLLNYDPDEKLVLPSKYNLYKIYQLQQDNVKAKAIKQDIITNYPESRYAEILINPELQVKDDENSPDRVYEDLYAKLVNQQYAEVISGADESARVFQGEDIVPKLELLKAQAKGRLYGYEEYTKALNYVALTYPDSQEGAQAKLLIDQTLPKLANAEFVSDSLSTSFKVIYKFEEVPKEEITGFAETLDEVLANVQDYKLTTSIDTYDLKTTFVVVHGLKSKGGAEGFVELFLGKEQDKIKKPHFVISSENYTIVQIHKNLETYLSTYN